MGFRFKQPLVGEKPCVTTLITAAEETRFHFDEIWREKDPKCHSAKILSGIIRESIEKRILQLKEKLANPVNLPRREGESGRSYDQRLKDTKKNIEKKIGNQANLEKKCGSNDFKRKVIKEAEEVFFQENFIDSLDQNPDLIAFSNGVFDLRGKIFRAGVKEDLISTYLPVNYRVHSEEELRGIQSYLKYFLSRG